MRNAKDETLNEGEFSRLVQTCRDSKDSLINQFIVLMAGILGMRIGEIAHIKKHWIDFEKETITIPNYEPCNCKYCIDCKKLDIKRRKKPQKKGKKKKKKIKPMQKRWHPKSSAGARTLPYGFNHDVKRIMEEMFNKYTEVPLTPIAISHKIRRLGESIGLKLFAHALRATAATRLAYDGMQARPLQVFMGWETLDMAEHYIRTCGSLTKKELDRVYPESKRCHIEYSPRDMFTFTNLGKEAVERKRWENEDEWLRQLIGDNKFAL